MSASQVEQLFPVGNPAIQSSLFHVEATAPARTRSCPACGRRIEVRPGPVECAVCVAVGTHAQAML